MENALYDTKDKLYLPILLSIILFVVYNNQLEVENYSLYFELYNNMSHFSMMLFLNPISDLFISADEYAIHFFLLYYGLTGLKIILETILEAISSYLIKSKFNLIYNLNHKRIFFQIRISIIELHFLQTKQAVLPFI